MSFNLYNAVKRCIRKLRLNSWHGALNVYAERNALGTLRRSRRAPEALSVSLKGREKTTKNIQKVAKKFKRCWMFQYDERGYLLF